jgi:hypothetical protein
MVQYLTFEKQIRVVAVSQDGEDIAISYGYDSSYTAKVNLVKMIDTYHKSYVQSPFPKLLNIHKRVFIK